MNMAAAEELRYLVLAVQREGNRMLMEALKPHGLTPSTAEVLRVLADHGPLSLGALGGLLVCEQGMPSRLVARMAEGELVRRASDPDDKRGLVISLTATGRKAERRVRAVEAAFHAAIAEALHGIDVAQVRAALRRLVAGRPSGDALRRRFAS